MPAPSGASTSALLQKLVEGQINDEQAVGDIGKKKGAKAFVLDTLHYERGKNPDDSGRDYEDDPLNVLAVVRKYRGE